MAIFRNFEQRGVTFETATFLFDAPLLIDQIDESEGEVRFIAVGQVDNDILTILYTERDERIRIISARLATKPEIDVYKNQI